MSEGLTQRLRELRVRVKEFIDREVIPQEPVIGEGGDAADKAMRRLMEEAKSRGLWALGHPVEVGGGGLSFMEFVYLNEIIGRSEFGTMAVGSLSHHDTLMWMRYATEEQKRTYLPGLVNGDFPWIAIGLTEPEVAGSDPTLMQTTAVLDGDQWVINGHKWFTSYANKASVVLVWAKTDPEASNKYRRFSAILVPAGTPGFEIVRAIPTMGHTGGNHCEVRFTDVRVPKTNLFGPRGEGFMAAQTRLGPGRIFHCMRWLGQMQRAFELMCARANVRYAHGSLLAEKGEIQRYVAESAADIQSLRLMTLDAARVIDEGRDARVQISLIKFHGARLLHDVIDRAIQVHGALGVTADTPLEKMYRDARYARLYDGPDEVHRMVVARRLLKDCTDGAPWAV